MSILDRFLEDRNAAAKISETEVRANSEAMKRINHLPAEEQEKWVGIYANVYNDIVDARGLDKAQEIAARSAWSRIPERFKKSQKFSTAELLFNADWQPSEYDVCEYKTIWDGEERVEDVFGKAVYCAKIETAELTFNPETFDVQMARDAHVHKVVNTGVDDTFTFEITAAKAEQKDGSWEFEVTVEAL